MRGKELCGRFAPPHAPSVIHLHLLPAGFRGLACSLVFICALIDVLAKLPGVISFAPMARPVFGSVGNWVCWAKAKAPRSINATVKNADLIYSLRFNINPP